MLNVSYFLFASRKGDCYQAVHGVSSIVKVSKDTVLTVGIVDQPASKLPMSLPQRYARICGNSTCRPLHYNYYRDGYEPVTGRFTQSDPIATPRLVESRAGTEVGLRAIGAGHARADRESDVSFDAGWVGAGDRGVALSSSAYRWLRRRRDYVCLSGSIHSSFGENLIFRALLTLKLPSQ